MCLKTVKACCSLCYIYFDNFLILISFLFFLCVCVQQSVLSDQCDLGIRFLDLRIARKPKGGSKLFFAHGIYTLMTVKVHTHLHWHHIIYSLKFDQDCTEPPELCVCVQEALDELATWLDAHPKEIVIISCTHFESLTDEDHIQLVEFIVMLFGNKLCSSQVP